ncbi:HD domain-containing protein [Taibaiella koreensis]|uniref:HD domain-containing protein n=1 Tax=Taibaiella koreensis TaxID=1268548 RepID=UPI000E59DF0E|nr:HD domain-containing protein [Taibaiella koreensis]
MRGKIINDPVYGFIRFPEPELMQVIEHPWFQRLRRIKQMGMAHLVYPGAVHTRFHHSLGAAHLMHIALNELGSKGIEISRDECIAARLAILMHDIGHGPFSHGLEHTIVHGISHEGISKMIMQRLNERFNGMLTEAISIFENTHTKTYLHQLVSSQLDMDRLDYLNRDSFYTGVSEGVIGYDRILQMLTVKDGNLVVEEKGIHSVEKFIIARRLMYWQVYLHKTVLGAEQLIIHILQRAKQLAQSGAQLFATPALHFFLYEKITGDDFAADPSVLDKFCLLDDADITASIKVWTDHPDPVLSRLCTMMQDRRLYKVRLGTQPLKEEFRQMQQTIMASGKINEDELPFYLFEGSTSNSTYNQNDERINILMKKGDVVNISQVDNALIGSDLTVPVEKFYICSIAPERAF